MPTGCSLLDGPAPDVRREVHLATWRGASGRDSRHTSMEMPVLADFSVPSQPGNERQVAERVRQAVAHLHLDQPQVERLATAVAEATLNAMEHGNHFVQDRPVAIRVEANDSELCVSITDTGCGSGDVHEQPDLDKKLGGEQSPRGWGLFLIEKMVDTVSDEVVNGGHTVCLSVHLRPGQVAG